MTAVQLGERVRAAAAPAAWSALRRAALGASQQSQKLSPPSPVMCGYTTAKVAPTATAASTAVPPERSTSRPAIVASGWARRRPRGARGRGLKWVSGIGPAGGVLALRGAAMPYALSFRQRLTRPMPRACAVRVMFHS